MNGFLLLPHKIHPSTLLPPLPSSELKPFILHQRKDPLVHRAHKTQYHSNFFNRNTYLIFPLSITKYCKTKMCCFILVTPCASFSLYPFYQSCPPPPPPLLLLLSLKKSIRINLTGERRRRGCRLSSFRQAKASTNSVPLFPNFILYLPAKSLPPVPSLIGRVSETLIVLWERERET